MKPDYVWVTAGAGSVESVKENFELGVFTHVTMPLEIMRSAPNGTRIVLFSSDYVAHEDFPGDPTKRTSKPRSLYAMTKLWLEEGFDFLERPNSVVIRVGSLYGKHFYEKTFPGKLTQRYPEPDKIVLPTNVIVPTLTRWAAEVLLRHSEFMFYGPMKKVYHLAPRGQVNVLNFGRLILGEGYRFEAKGLDLNRPRLSQLGCSFGEAPDWLELWRSGWWV